MRAHVGGHVQPLYFSRRDSRLIQSSLNIEISTTSAALYFTDVRAIYWFLTVLSSGCSEQKRRQEGSLQNSISDQERHSMPAPSCWDIQMTGFSLSHLSQHDIKVERTMSQCSSASDCSEEPNEHSRYSIKIKLFSQHSWYVLVGNRQPHLKQ